MNIRKFGISGEHGHRPKRICPVRKIHGAESRS